MCLWGCCKLPVQRCLQTFTQVIYKCMYIYNCFLYLWPSLINPLPNLPAVAWTWNTHQHHVWNSAPILWHYFEIYGAFERSGLTGRSRSVGIGIWSLSPLLVWANLLVYCRMRSLYHMLQPPHEDRWNHEPKELFLSCFCWVLSHSDALDFAFLSWVISPGLV